MWAAALSYVGVRFRLHGRDPLHGLDCVGLVAASHAAAGYPVDGVPADYRMRDVSLEQLEEWLRGAGLSAIDDCLVEDCLVEDRAVGDVVVSDMGRGQLHLMIAGDAACVHAHAGLRRVVVMPGLAGMVLGRWRVRSALWGKSPLRSD